MMLHPQEKRLEYFISSVHVRDYPNKDELWAEIQIDSNMENHSGDGAG